MNSILNFFSYKSRIGRQKYIISLIVVAVVSTIVEFLYFFVTFSSTYFLLSKIGFLSIIFVFLLGIVIAFIPVFLTSTVIIKRFHDIGKSGWWFFALLIPIYNIHLSIGLLTERGTAGPNLYGEDILPSNTPDDIFNRFSQNKTARIIADILFIGLFLLFFTLSVVSKIQQQTTQQNIINKIIQSTNMTTTNSVSGNQGTNIPGKMTTGIYPSGCYTITYDPKSLIVKKDEVHEGIISFTDSKGNPVFDIAPSLLGEVGAVATQTASQFNPKPAVQDFVTTSGIKGKELIDSNWWEILIPTASTQNGDTIILSIGSSNLNNLKDGERVAQSVDFSSCLR